jgi:hypothetical protein
MKSFARITAVCCSLAAMLAVAAWAQEPEEGEEFQPRLPAFFSGIVDETQKEAIYAIQTKYNEQIAPLREQIADLLKKQQAEVEALLTADQLDQVQKRRDEARKERDITRNLTPEQRRAAQEAARKAFLEAARKAQAEASKTDEPKADPEQKEG